MLTSGATCTSDGFANLTVCASKRCDQSEGSAVAEVVRESLGRLLRRAV